MSFLKKLSPTPESIQKEYVEKRKRALFKNDDAKTEAVKKVIENLHAEHNIKADWHETYLRIHEHMQCAALTINLDAGSWFTTDNTYATYAQMYERGVGADGKMRLVNDSLNPAKGRAITDDLVTIPDDWANSPRFSQRKRIYKAMHATGATKDSLKMASDNPEKAPTLVGGEKTGYSSTNKHFMPGAKQVFAALNYGRRPHGSTPTYGYSFLVLKPSLKEDAIYYPADTFNLANSGTRNQATFNTIGALLERANSTLRRDLWASCYHRHYLADIEPGDMDLLLEAHLFKQIKMAEDIESLFLSRLRKSDLPQWPDAEWKNIINNATKWCQRNHVRLVFTSP